MTILVFDSAPLSAFARARRLDVLDQLCRADERATTNAVVLELRAGAQLHPELADAVALPWLRVVSLETLPELALFAAWARRLGSGERDLGETTVLAWAEAHGATAVTDDQTAVQVAREKGVSVRRTLSLVARGVRLRILDEPRAEQLVDELLSAGARFPFSAGQFIRWARDHDLLA